MVKVELFKKNGLFQGDEKIFCFGAGKMFDRFLRDNEGVEVKAVIDNYVSGNIYDSQRYRDRSTITFKKFVDSYDGDAIVIITTKHYVEVVSQMDEESSLDNLECYIFDWWGRDNSEVEELYKKLGWQRGLGRNDALVPQEQMNFQIWNGVELYFNAGTKAPQDVQEILKRCNYFNLDIHIVEGNCNSWQVERNINDWARCNANIKDGSILFLQHLGRQSEAETAKHIWEIKRNKRVRIITLIHDIERLRITCDTPKLANEFAEMLKYTDVFIVHNSAMKVYMEKQGILSDRIVCLEIFDYLTDKDIPNHSLSKDVIVAGNFHKSKSAYALLLNQISKVKFHLFGQDFHGMTYENVIYHGAVSPEEIIDLLPDGYGLVWDGPSLDTCDGDTGRYLRYNNPHKLSLYIVSGLPIIIWDEAAEKDFVVRNNLGFTIKSLHDLPEVLSRVNNEQYELYKDNVKRIAQKLRSGEYTKRAIEEAEKIIGSMS